MFNYFTELMLMQYFTIDAIFGRFIKDRKKLFERLSKIYLLKSKDAEYLYELSESEKAKEIVTESDYFRYRRTKKYMDLNNLGFPVNVELDELIIIKGTAISAAKKLGIVGDSAISKFSACNLLKSAADSGIIVAMNALGVLQEEGIIFRKDKAAGLHNIVKTANWNSDQGLIMALYYDEANAQKYLTRMSGNLARASLTEALEEVEATYGKASGRADETYQILEKAFDQGILKPEVYSKQYARILFSDVISHRDKESLFFSSGKEVSAYASDLPLKLSPAAAVEYDADIVNIMTPYHGQEIEKLISGLNNSDLRNLPSYRPLCIVSDSRFIIENFAESVQRSILSGNVEHIEVSDLAGYDLEPTKNNIFVRSCNEDENNVYFMFFRGEINEKVFEMAKNFLQTEKRSKFRLLQPGVCIDISAIMPICFSDRQNAKLLRPYCEIINIENFSSQEKGVIADKILSVKGQLYGIEEIKMEPPAYERLAVYPLEEMERILDSVVCDNRKQKQKLNLTEELILPYLSDRAQTRNTYGFGGDVHE